MKTSVLFTTLTMVALVVAGPHDAFRRRHHGRTARYPPLSRAAMQQQEQRDCVEGAWKCVGTELQRCNYDAWIPIADCTGDNIVCSANETAVGCIWSWSLDSNPVTVSAIPSSLLSAGPTATPASSSAPAPSVTISTSAENCDASSASSVPASSSSVATSATSVAVDSSAVANSSSVTVARSTSVVVDSSSAPIASASATASVSSLAANNFYAGGPTRTSSSNVWARSTSDVAPTTSAVSTTSAWSQSASANESSVSHTARQTGSSSAPSGQYSAPHYVIYADNWLTQMPSASDISEYNRFILAFWMSDAGAVDNAVAWAGWDASYRQSVLDEYHNAGIALMVSAFGATDSPTTNGADPTQTAQDLAAWVKQYGLDGVDVDYEDMTAMNSDVAEDWLITFQQELRRRLPAPYLISHAPVAPWFTSGDNYPSGAYVDVHKQTGNGIDFYNVQFYNQGDGVYTDCSSLIYDSGSAWPDTSVAGINSYAGVPMNKIVIGKPLHADDAANGYTSPSTLNTCVGQAQSLGWNGGVMFWQYNTNANSIMGTVRG